MTFERRSPPLIKEPMADWTDVVAAETAAFDKLDAATKAAVKADDALESAFGDLAGRHVMTLITRCRRLITEQRRAAVDVANAQAAAHRCWLTRTQAHRSEGRQ